jgi:predicted ATPase
VAAEPASGHKTEARSRQSSAAQSGVFSQSGDYWTIGLETSRFLIKDIKGLHYLQRLLQHPGKEFHALDLLKSAGPGTITADTVVGREEALPVGITFRPGLSGDAGEMLDAQAKREYRRRLRQLNELLEDQRERGNHEHADQIESEIEFLSREIERAVGIGGRDRRMGSNAERARLSVTAAIKTALEKISQYDPTLSEWLDGHIRTGLFCRYAEDISVSTAWQFSADERGNAFARARPDPAYTHFRATNLLLPLEERTTFVGRDAEWNALRRVLEEVRSGSGQVVTIAGAPGVGKTRIAAEFGREVLLQGTLVLAGSCYDRNDPLPFVPFIEMLEGALANAPSPQVFRNALADEAPEIARFMPQLRRLFPDIVAPLELPPEQTRRVLLGAIMQVLARLGANGPILLLIDDLHWADEGTLSLLNYLARSIGSVPMMIIGTYRDNELDPRGALAKMFDEFTRLRVLSRMELSGLSVSSVSEIIRALSGRKPPHSLTNLIFSGTQGNPFFIEELFRHMMEGGTLFDSSGEFRQDLQVDEIDLPQSLRLVIGRRLSRLSEPTQRILSTAALIGTSFTFQLVETATGIKADELLDHLEEAEHAGLISGTIQHAESRFQFWHEMVRLAVVAKLSAPRRQRLHLNIAHAIERTYAGTLDERANDLAHHLWHAGNMADPERTIRYLAMAVKRELSQSAYEAALQHLRRAFAVLKELPDCQERGRLELDLQMDCGMAILATRGWYVSEFREAYSRARELCLIFCEETRLLQVLFGLRFSHLVRGELRQAKKYADEVMELALRLRDDAMLVGAFWALGSSQFYLGEFDAAHLTFEEGIRHYKPQVHHAIAFQVGQDPCMSCLCHDAQALWTLGYADRADQKAAKSLALARRVEHPFTLAYCLTHLALYFLIRREYARSLECCAEGGELCRKHGFVLPAASMRSYAFMAHLVQGEPIAESSLHELRPIPEYQLISTWFRSALAEAIGNQGNTIAASAFLDQAFQLMDRNDERFVEPEIHRIRGELILKQVSDVSATPLAVRSAQTDAELNFRNATAIASRSDARMLGLRATVSLSRLLKTVGRRGEALDALSPSYRWFTEGFDTPDLTAARALLEDLELGS